MVSHHPMTKGFAPPTLAAAYNPFQRQAFVPGAAVTRRRVGEYPARDWLKMKCTIEQLFLHSDKTKQQVAQILGNRCHFFVTVEQLKRRIKEWGFVKNLTKRVKCQISRIVRERRRRFPDRRIKVIFRGSDIPDNEIRKWELLKDGDSDEYLIAGLEVYALDRHGASLAETIRAWAETTVVDYLQAPTAPLSRKNVFVETLSSFAPPLDDEPTQYQYTKLVQEARANVHPGIHPVRGVILTLNTLRNLLEAPVSVDGTSEVAHIPSDTARKIFSACVHEIFQRFPRTINENIAALATMAIYLSLYLWADPNTQYEAPIIMAAVIEELGKEVHLHSNYGWVVGRFYMHALLHQCSLLASRGEKDKEHALELLQRPELECFHDLPAVQNQFWDCRKCLDILMSENPQAHFQEGTLNEVLRQMSSPLEVATEVQWWQDSDSVTERDIGYRVRYCGIKYECQHYMKPLEEDWSEPEDVGIYVHAGATCRHKFPEQEPQLITCPSTAGDSDTSGGQEFTPNTESSISVVMETPSSEGSSNM